ncbi:MULTISPECIES: TolC family protein [Cyanophyceae]|uniref:TolC family protein n=1 Tax=Cyanophyceae TaxID=3028117 RepID=UPI001689EB2A|nr:MULTISPECIES: TolC family protein [Cyanophyceae]MBD1915533.1 TolC family protein [Phormidium sp. FACHB-77]MBD2050593.1 TolC family protein [Leptolyngbya sp. FACHB-60]
MVSMLYSYCRCLIPLSLGITLSSWSAVGLANPEPRPLADDSLGITITQVESEALELSPAVIEDVPATETGTPGLEPGEEAVPLDADGAITPFSRAQTGPLIPQSDRPTDQGFETPPDYLTPSPNPLLVPTQPEEVEILGTQPLSLETALELAYRNSEELRVAQLRLERNQAGLRVQQAARLPTVDLSADLQTSNQSSSGSGGTFDSTSTTAGSTLRTDYDLGLSGERSARIRAAERQARVSELQVEQTREDLRLNTTTDYYAVQEAIEQIRINQAFLEAAERNLRDTQLREEVGVGTRFDVLQAEVQVANARQTLTQATSQRQISQRQLARRLNIQPSIDLTTLAVNIAGAWPLSLEESIVLAFQNRSELEQFLVEREFNDAQRQASLAAVRPNLGVFAQYGVQSLLSSSSGASSRIDDGFSLGARLNWRLFDGGAARAGADQSEIDIETDESEFESARNDIRVQVEEAYYTLVSNQSNIDTASVAVNQAEEALELANLRFNAGVGTQLEVINAIRDLTEAQGNLVTAVLEYNRALARLERSVSNLDSPTDDTPETIQD